MLKVLGSHLAPLHQAAEFDGAYAHSVVHELAEDPNEKQRHAKPHYHLQKLSVQTWANPCQDFYAPTLDVEQAGHKTMEDQRREACLGECLEMPRWRHGDDEYI